LEGKRVSEDELAQSQQQFQTCLSRKQHLNEQVALLAKQIEEMTARLAQVQKLNAELAQK
jgi:hypothetical protein